VEHGPIQPAASPVASLLDKPVDAGVDHLYCEGLGELRQRVRPAAGDAGNRTLCSDFDTETQGVAERPDNLPNDSQVILSVAY
jgi:hypothetical protein